MRRGPAAGFALSVCLLATVAPAVASHTSGALVSFEDPFEPGGLNDPFVEWSHTGTGLGPSGAYLGPLGDDTISYRALDAVVGGSARFIDLRLAFDIVVTEHPVAMPGQLVVSHWNEDGSGGTIHTASVGLQSTLEHHETTFRLKVDSNTGIQPDVILTFATTGLTGALWGLDNLIYEVVPEPSTALLLGLGLVGLAAARR